MLLAAPALAQSPRQADPAIAAEVANIRAIDNHAHVPQLVARGENDDEWDALPCSGHLEPSADPFIIRAEENALFPAAWKALWGAQNGRQAAAARAQKRAELGDRYPAWVLDQLGTETMFANRIALTLNGTSRGLTPPRFRWVPFADALMYPLNNSALANTPDRKFFYGREEMLLRRYMKESGRKAMTTSLDVYLEKLVRPTLERWKQQGAVAIKFEMAYLRSLEVGPATKEQAARVMARYAWSSTPPPAADYKLLQDFLFRYMAAQAGRLGLAVHIHTGAGCGSYFFLNGSDPALLDGVLNDKSLRATNFVLIHGGWPFHKSAAYLLGKPNVYADFSVQNLLLSRDKGAEILRDYLEWFPEKIMFGTDLAPGGDEVDWEEVGWVANRTGRDALALALTDMMNAGEISRERALQLARMVMRENAVKLYGFDDAK
ncbi:MAG TPA: amidohydrolase family protein [Terriglobales bacterium]|nr:amidohydrolase family protein [Terriglobales bacterium]